jgi:hypothetical protein
MRTYKIILFALFLIIAGNSNAQISVTITPPEWGPVGYTNVRYYYLPDVEAYYDINTSMFIYFNGAAWISAPSLPGPYASYDLYHGYKVVLTDYHGTTPYTNFNEHKQKYNKGYHGAPQRTYKEDREQNQNKGQDKGKDKNK